MASASTKRPLEPHRPEIESAVDRRPKKTKRSRLGNKRATGKASLQAPGAALAAEEQSVLAEMFGDMGDPSSIFEGRSFIVERGLWEDKAAAAVDSVVQVIIRHKGHIVTSADRPDGTLLVIPTLEHGACSDEAARLGHGLGRYREQYAGLTRVSTRWIKDCHQNQRWLDPPKWVCSEHGHGFSKRYPRKDHLDHKVANDHVRDRIDEYLRIMDQGPITTRIEFYARREEAEQSETGSKYTTLPRSFLTRYMLIFEDCSSAWSASGVSHWRGEGTKTLPKSGNGTSSSPVLTPQPTHPPTQSASASNAPSRVTSLSPFGTAMAVGEPSDRSGNGNSAQSQLGTATDERSDGPGSGSGNGNSAQSELGAAVREQSDGSGKANGARFELGAAIGSSTSRAVGEESDGPGIDISAQSKSGTPIASSTTYAVSDQPDGFGNGELPPVTTSPSLPPSTSRSNPTATTLPESCTQTMVTEPLANKSIGYSKGEQEGTVLEDLTGRRIHDMAGRISQTPLKRNLLQARLSLVLTITETEEKARYVTVPHTIQHESVTDHIMKAMVSTQSWLSNLCPATDGDTDAHQQLRDKSVYQPPARHRVTSCGYAVSPMSSSPFRFRSTRTSPSPLDTFPSVATIAPVLDILGIWESRRSTLAAYVQFYHTNFFLEYQKAYSAELSGSSVFHDKMVESPTMPWEQSPGLQSILITPWHNPDRPHWSWNLVIINCATEEMRVVWHMDKTVDSVDSEDVKTAATWSRLFYFNQTRLSEHHVDRLDVHHVYLRYYNWRDFFQNMVSEMRKVMSTSPRGLTKSELDDLGYLLR